MTHVTQNSWLYRMRRCKVTMDRATTNRASRPPRAWRPSPIANLRKRRTSSMHPKTGLHTHGEKGGGSYTAPPASGGSRCCSKRKKIAAGGSGHPFSLALALAAALPGVTAGARCQLTRETRRPGSNGLGVGLARRRSVSRERGARTLQTAWVAIMMRLVLYGVL